MRIPTVLTAATLGVLPIQAQAAGKINYGSRAGMDVTIVRMSGLNTANASILTKHTRENAISFCKEYVGKVTKKCVDEEMAVRLNDEIQADCTTGRFVDFFGAPYQFMGKATGKENETMMAKYVIKDLVNNEIADGSSASGYPVNMEIFRALCPMKAPSSPDDY